MNARSLDRTLRGAGAVLLATIVVAVGWSALSSPEARWLTGAQAFGGTIEHFGDDAIVVSTSTAGLRSIRIGPETVVTESGGRSGPGSACSPRTSHPRSSGCSMPASALRRRDSRQPDRRGGPRLAIPPRATAQQSHAKASPKRT